jgi:RND family efflux transporter MFP subunit
VLKFHHLLSSQGNVLKPHWILLTFSLLYFPAVLGQPVPVTVAPVDARPLAGELQISGNIVSLQEGDVSTEVAGLVWEVKVDEGDKVAAGQPLLQLRDGPAKWRLAEAQANLKSALAQLELRQLEQQRLEKLIATKSISQGQVDIAVAQTHQAEADVAARKATVALRQDELANHLIKAPFEGVITNKMVERGRWLSAGDPVFHLASHHKLRIELAIPQQYFPMMDDTTSVLVRSELTADSIKATIGQIVPYADRSRSFQLWATVDNPQGKWLPGMSAIATLSWPGSTRFPWRIPADALLRKADGTALVWRIVGTVERPVVEAVTVEPGEQVGDTIAVASSTLSGGDRVVIRGNEILQPGQQVILPDTTR